MNLNTQIKKSNALVESSYRLSIQELRVVFLAIAKAQGSNRDLSDKEMYTITAREYSEYSGLSLKMSYRDLVLAQNHLFERQITLHKSPEGQIIDPPVRTRWIQADTKSDNGSGEIRLQFSTLVVPYLTLLNKNFTYYELQNIAKLSNPHAVRIFEMMVQWRKFKETPVISIDSFRNSLILKDKTYDKFYDLKRRIIQPSIDLINQNIDNQEIHSVSFTTVKTGRKVTGVKFYWKLKRKNTQITEDYIQQNTRTGESWDQARKRLTKEVKEFNN